VPIEDIIIIYADYKMMLNLDALVVAKRMSCDDDCSYQQRLKKYRQQRQNLGELNRLATSKPRPTVNVSAFVNAPYTPTKESPVKVEEEADTVSEDSTQSAFEPEPEETESTAETETVRRPRNKDEGIEEVTLTAVKRMFGNDDILSIKRLQTGNPDLDWREAEFAKQQVQEYIDRIVEDARELDRQTMERRNQNETTIADITRSAREDRMRRIADMKQNVEAYEAYRRSAPYYEGIRPAMDEYYANMREDIGVLEELRR
jgi:hypothetical protein